MDFTQGLSSLLGLGIASGLNLYAAVLTVGLAYGMLRRESSKLRKFRYLRLLSSGESW